MTKSTFGDQSTTASSNTTIDGNDASENCVMSGLNNIDRALAAMGKSLGTFITTSGVDTYTATFAPVPDALATDFFYGVNFASANTSTTPTFNPSGLGPKTITDTSGNALVAGALNGRHILIYDGTNFRVLNPVKNPASVISIADATNGGLNVATSSGAVTLNIKPSDLLTKTTPTSSDSILIQDAAASNAAKTATIQSVVNASVPVLSSLTNSLGSDVALNNQALYFTGPTVAQGTTGTWFVSGTVTMTDTLSATPTYFAKLWDGTTIIASASITQPVTSGIVSISLSGFISSPAGNLRISVNEPSSANGAIKFNATGNSKDSTITAIRIA